MTGQEEEKRSLGFWVKRATRRTRLDAVLYGVYLVVGTWLTMLVGVSDGHPKPGVVWALYHTHRLLLLNPAGLPGPKPAWASAVLNLLYFLAPLFTLKMSIGFLQRLSYNPARLARKSAGHILVAGAGRTGSEIHDALRKQNYRVIPMDRDQDNPAIAHWHYEHLPYVIGDIARETTLREGGIEKAAALVVVSGDDVANLDCAYAAKKIRGREFPCLVQISDPYLYTAIKKHGQSVMNAALQPEDFVNPYSLVAREVVSELTKWRQKRSCPESRVVIAGFGKLGRMVVRELLKTDSPQMAAGSVTVVDNDDAVGRRWRVFSSLGGLPESAVQIVVGDVRDVAVWRGLRQRCGNAPISVVVATDDDSSNVGTSFIIKDNLPGELLVVTRLFKHVSSLEGVESVRSIVFSDIASQYILRAILSKLGT